MILAKRADEEYFVPKPILVLLVIILALFFWAIGYAVHSTFGFGPNPNVYKPLKVEQMEYMAEVRVRNMDSLAYEAAQARREVRGKGVRY
jgi:hypothetical protein